MLKIMKKENKVLLVVLALSTVSTALIMSGIFYIVYLDDKGELNPPELNEFCESKGGTVGGTFGEGMSCWIKKDGVDIKYKVFKKGEKILIVDTTSIKPLW